MARQDPILNFQDQMTKHDLSLNFQHQIVRQDTNLNFQDQMARQDPRRLSKLSRSDGKTRSQPGILSCHPILKVSTYQSPKGVKEIP